MYQYLWKKGKRVSKGTRGIEGSQNEFIRTNRGKIVLTQSIRDFPEQLVKIAPLLLNFDDAFPTLFWLLP